MAQADHASRLEDLELVDDRGERVRLSDFYGRPTVLVVTRHLY